MYLGYACDVNPLLESMAPGGHAGTMRTLLISLALFALGCADSHGSVALHPGLPDVALPEAAPATLFGIIAFSDTVAPRHLPSSPVP